MSVRWNGWKFFSGVNVAKSFCLFLAVALLIFSFGFVLAENVSNVENVTEDLDEVIVENVTVIINESVVENITEELNETLDNITVELNESLDNMTEIINETIDLNETLENITEEFNESLENASIELNETFDNVSVIINETIFENVTVELNETLLNETNVTELNMTIFDVMFGILNAFAEGITYAINVFTMTMTGGEGVGATYGARIAMVWNSGGEGVGAVYSANVTVLDAANSPEVIRNVSIISSPNQSTGISNNVTYNLTIENTGNVVDSYDLSVVNSDSVNFVILEQDTISILGEGSKINISLIMGDVEAGNYSVFVNVSSQNDASVWDVVEIKTEIINVVNISSVAASPSVIINGTYVNLTINASNYEAVFANVTHPSGYSVLVNLVDEVSYNYSNVNELGDYSVVFYANDSYGNLDTISKAFTAAMPINTTINVMVNVGASVNVSNDVTFRLIYPDNGEVIFEHIANGSFNIEVPDVEYNIVFFGAFNGTMNMTLRNVNLTENTGKIIGLDKHREFSDYLVTYGIDNDYSFNTSEVIFSYASEVYINEANLQLWKCDNYNLSGRVCTDGVWVDVSSSALKNTDGNYFTYNTTSFSGFAIKEYIAPVTTGGGGGGTTAAVIEENVTVEENAEEIVEENITEEIPEELFDIRMDLEDTSIDFANQLTAVVTYESFGSIPTPVNLTFEIFDMAGNLLYSKDGFIIVTVEEVRRYGFPELELPNGEYEFVFTTLYNVDVVDKFRSGFTVGKTGFNILDYWWVLVGLVLVGLLIGFRKNIFGGKKVIKRKKRTLKSKILSKHNFKYLKRKECSINIREHKQRALYLLKKNASDYDKL